MDELEWHTEDNNHWYTGEAEDPEGFGLRRQPDGWWYYMAGGGWAPMPGSYTLEEAKAMAIVMQKMGG